MFEVHWIFRYSLCKVHTFTFTSKSTGSNTIWFYEISSHPLTAHLLICTGNLMNSINWFTFKVNLFRVSLLDPTVRIIFGIHVSHFQFHVEDLVSSKMDEKSIWVGNRSIFTSRKRIPHASNWKWSLGYHWEMLPVIWQDYTIWSLSCEWWQINPKNLNSRNWSKKNFFSTKFMKNS